MPPDKDIPIGTSTQIGDTSITETGNIPISAPTADWTQSPSSPGTTSQAYGKGRRTAEVAHADVDFNAYSHDELISIIKNIQQQNTTLTELLAKALDFSKFANFTMPLPKEKEDEKMVETEESPAADSDESMGEASSSTQSGSAASKWADKTNSATNPQEYPTPKEAKEATEKENTKKKEKKI